MRYEAVCGMMRSNSIRSAGDRRRLRVRSYMCGS